MKPLFFLVIAVFAYFACEAQRDVKDFFKIETAIDYLNSPAFKNDVLDTIKQRCIVINLRTDINKSKQRQLVASASDTSFILNNICFEPFDYYLKKDTAFTPDNIYLYREGYAKMKMLLHYSPKRDCNSLVHVITTFLDNGNLRLEYFPYAGSEVPWGPRIMGNVIILELQVRGNMSVQLISFGNVIYN